MKKTHYYFFALICAGMMFLPSCSEEKVGNSDLSIYVLDQSTTKSASLDASVNEKGSLWCTGDNIKWYNAKTGELKLNISRPPSWSSKLTIFLNDIELFSLDFVNHSSSIMQPWPFIDWDDPDYKVIHIGCKCGNKFDHIIGPDCESIDEYIRGEGRYTITIYPKWTQEDLDKMAQISGQDYVDNLVEESKAFDKVWNIFIEQLKKEGKYRE